MFSRRWGFDVKNFNIKKYINFEKFILSMDFSNRGFLPPVPQPEPYEDFTSPGRYISADLDEMGRPIDHMLQAGLYDSPFRLDPTAGCGGKPGDEWGGATHPQDVSGGHLMMVDQPRPNVMNPSPVSLIEENLMPNRGGRDLKPWETSPVARQNSGGTFACRMNEKGFSGMTEEGARQLLK
jgi:hypothetical protein